MRPLLHFTRMSGPAYASVVRTLDDDESFRLRVVEAAPPDPEAGLGRVGWLWLSRPEGWEEDVAGALTEQPNAREQPSTGRLRRERDGAEAAAARARRDLEFSEQARRRAEDHLTDEQTVRQALEDQLAAVRSAHDRLGEERNEAVRKLKDVEQTLATARRDLRIARSAARQAEADLAARPPPGSGSATQELAGRVDRELREVRRRAGRAVTEASEAAAALQRSLEAADAALDPRLVTRADGRDRSRRRQAGGAGSRSGRVSRRLPGLPPGLLRGTPEADRLVLRASDVLVVIDGYNLARTAWHGLAPAEERRRTVAMVDELGARSGAAMRLVFDGVDDAVAPAASRSTRVQFSATGQTADDAILDLLDALAADQAVVVVSSDREIIDGTRGAGGEAMTSEAFLVAVGR